MKKAHYLAIVFATLLGLQSCREKEQAHTPAFQHLIGSGEGQFRGTELGQSLSAVRNRETGPVKIEDDYGLIYILDLGEGIEASSEYYTDPQDSSHKVVAIISNITLQSEVEAASLYRELQFWLDARYDVPEGGLGYFQWKDKTKNLEVILRLMDSKTSVSINFFRSKDNFGTI